ncbi:MAG: hypothetical protein GQ540_03775 [Lutibacter sp.]|uniref:hypothetical protein n=1 Tax=Lutibacter sp. TaxID=1925666 RepID=UPI0019D8B435|nr:hypothetical protein [Lutibacter sp.]NOR27632.1 hypothetical protein [Lutibacter sp.]
MCEWKTKTTETEIETTLLYFKDSYGEYQVEREGEFPSIENVIDYFIIPVLRSAGFSDETIKEYIESNTI